MAKAIPLKLNILNGRYRKPLVSDYGSIAIPPMLEPRKLIRNLHLQRRLIRNLGSLFVIL